VYLKEIKIDGCFYAIVLQNNYCGEGINFFTPGDFSQQLGYMKRPAGYEIPAHRHNIVEREIKYTQEVLFIKTGKIKVNFYNNNNKHISDFILNSGDVIMLCEGAHGFEFIEKSEVIEVKQGPYLGDNDKEILGI
jgi:hypothetical protein